jgi:hypothetical protein
MVSAVKMDTYKHTLVLKKTVRIVLYVQREGEDPGKTQMLRTLSG